mgnify:CR=1 FL=1
MTAAGLSGLAYGVFNPEDLVARGLATTPPDAAEALRTLFTKSTPYLFGPS